MFKAELFSKSKYELLSLTAKQEPSSVAVQVSYYKTDSYFDKFCSSCDKDYDYVVGWLLYDAPRFNITLLPCPFGFQLRDDPPGCECHPILM